MTAQTPPALPIAVLIVGGVLTTPST
jgi:hypothetical protein